MKEIILKTQEVIFREDLYPRIKTNHEIVQKYSENLSVLPPIEINQHNELIDGWHRWTAHRKTESETISAFITQTESDAHLLELAVERNSRHGLQLSQEDKRDMARRIYNSTPERERDGKKKHLAKILSVPERTVRDWLSRIDKDDKERRNKIIFDLWLSCHTQQEIADFLGIGQSRLAQMEHFIKIGNLAKIDKTNENLDFLTKEQIALSDHAIDFDPPIYNVWKRQEKTPGSNYFGNTETQWLDNLLYLYTKPFDIVVDPFAGGGSTIEVCKKRLRRYWVSDRKPTIEREREIRVHDITKGLPSLSRWEGVKLVYLDPPYWKQAEGKYSQDSEDLSNMSLDEYNKTLSGFINSISKKIVGAHIALIIRATQWNSPDKMFIDHVADMIKMVNSPLAMRISAPYESQQCNAQMVEWAKFNRQILAINRDIVVWKP